MNYSFFHFKVFFILKVPANNVNRAVLGQLNINFIRSKFDMLSRMIKDNIYVLIVSETKLDSSFPLSQFIIEGNALPFRYDRNSRGGDILFFVREDIPAKKTNTMHLKVLKGFLWNNPQKIIIINHLQYSPKNFG